MNGPEIAPLLGSDDPWVALVARRDLLGEGITDADRRKVADDPRVAGLLAELDTWPPSRKSSRAYDPKDAIWKTAVVGDFGLQRNDDRIASLADRLLASLAPDGTFVHGGFDHTKTYDSRGYQCITHTVTEALAGFGYGRDPRLGPAVEQIQTTQRLDGGWHPNRDLQPGKSREAEPSCPFGTLNVLRAAIALGENLPASVTSRAAEFLLQCWTRRAEPFRPVGFGIGSTFGKLAYPFATYGLLKVIDTLTALPAIRSDARLIELVSVAVAQGQPDGWRAGTVSRAWSDFDFGQKTKPSAWITLLVLRAQRRVQRSRLEP